MNNDLKKILQKLEKRGDSGGINITFDEKGISSVRGKDGHTPVKGVDYFTEKELRQIIDVVKQMATPVKGKDYFTATEVAQMIRTLEGKLKHGRDGRDGIDGRDGKDAEEVDARKVAIDAINFLESFEGDARLSAKALKDLDEAVTDILQKGADFELSEKQITTIKDLLPKYPPMNAGGSGATFLKSLRDVDLSGLTKNADGKYVLGGGSSLPDQTGNAGKFLTTDGTDASWATAASVSSQLYPPLEAPTTLGAIHIDTDTGEIYMSIGTSAVEDWKLLTSTAYTLTNAITEQGDNRIYEDGRNKVRE